MSDTFCILPWIHLHTWPSGDAMLCCLSANHVVGNIVNTSINEVINNDKMKQIRRDMLAGKKVAECSNCYKMEEYKNTSWRQSFNFDFEDVIDERVADTKPDGEITPKLLYMDFRFSNLCNLACKTCGSGLSSSIASTPMEKFGEQESELYRSKNLLSGENILAVGNAKPNLFNEEILPHLETTRAFYFAGGEPLMHKEHFEILTYLDEHKMYDKQLRYSTNLTTLEYKKNNLLDIWKRFNEVYVICSIDHCGDKLEYIRQNSIAERTFKNFDALLASENIRTSICYVFSIYNAYYLEEFFQFVMDRGYLEKLMDLQFNYAFGDINSVSCLPEFAKEELRDKIKKDINSELFARVFGIMPEMQQNLEGILTVLEDPRNEEAFDKFISKVKNTDSYYKTDINKVLPWVGSVINRYEEMKRVN